MVHFGNMSSSFLKSETYPYIGSRHPLVGIFTKEKWKLIFMQKPCMQIFMAVLFIIARTLDCSFSMSKRVYSFIPPAAMGFHLEAGRRGSGGALRASPSSSHSSLPGCIRKLSPISCPAFHCFFCVCVRPGGRWCIMACEWELHSYMQFLGILYHHSSSHLAFTCLLFTLLDGS